MNLAAALTLFVTFGLLFALSVPVAVALGSASILTAIAFQSFPLVMVPQRMYGALNSWTLLAIPFFVLASTIIARTSIARRLIDFADALVHRVPGGLGIVAVAAAIVFAAISGSGPATVAALGALLVPALGVAGYKRGFAAALVASSGGLGIVIPPSIALIIYGVIAEAPVSKLFIAGVIPGLLVGGALIAVVLMQRRKSDAQRAAPVSPLWPAFRRAVPALLTPVIILGGIYSGMFTPTESAAVAAVYAFGLAVVVYREMNWARLVEILSDAAVTSAVIMLLVACASVYSLVLTTEGIAQGVAHGLLGLTTNRYALLLIIHVILLMAGCFIDAISIFYIFLPMFLPVVTVAGINPIHFGILMTVNLAIGQVTPPIGVNLFTVSGVTGVPVKDVIAGIWPLIGAELLALAVITFVPQLSLALV